MSEEIIKLSCRELQKKIAKALDQTLNLKVGVRLVEPHTIQRSEGKAKRVVDQRKM